MRFKLNVAADIEIEAPDEETAMRIIFDYDENIKIIRVHECDEI